MVQDFQVLRCFSCQSFQVQQVKKVNRWSCKLCGEKQTLLKEFGRGSGADCRRHVQKLNALRGAMMEEQEHHTWSLWEQAEEEEQRSPEEEEQVNTQPSTPTQHADMESMFKPHTHPTGRVSTQTPVSQPQVSQPQVSQPQVSQPQASRWSKYLDTHEEDEDKAEDKQNVLMDRKHLYGNHMTDRKRKRDGGRDRCSPEQHKPGLMRRPKTARTTIPNQTGLTQARTTIPNPTGVSQTRTTSLNPTGVSQTRTTSLKPTVVSRTRTTSLNPTGPERTCLNWSYSPHRGICKLSRWDCFLSSDSQGQAGEGPSGSRQSHKVVCNDVITQPPDLARPRPLLPVSSMFESGEELSFDDFLSEAF